MTPRDRAILRRYDAGDKLVGIATRYSVSAERVRLLVKTAGHTKPRGWRLAERQQHAATLFRRGWSTNRIAHKLNQSVTKTRQLLRATGALPTVKMRLYGLDDSEYRRFARLLPADGHVQHAYATHRRNSHLHAQAWEFTLATWWGVWRRSGHWEQSVSMTGSRRGYVMTRRNPRRPWSPANVRVVLMAKVLRRGGYGPRSPERAFLVGRAKLATFTVTAPDARTILRVYRQRRASAKLVHQPWSLSLVDWWRIWEQSGHWDQRGVHGFLMCRQDTRLGWSTRNVRIVSTSAPRRRPHGHTNTSSPYS